MELKKKLSLLEEMLEVEQGYLSPEMELEQIENWDSMAKLSLIVLMDEEFEKTLTGEDIKGFVLVQDIINYMG